MAPVPDRPVVLYFVYLHDVGSVADVDVVALAIPGYDSVSNALHQGGRMNSESCQSNSTLTKTIADRPVAEKLEEKQKLF